MPALTPRTIPQLRAALKVPKYLPPQEFKQLSDLTLPGKTESPNGFQLKPSFLNTRQLPVPDEMRAKLGEALRASGQYLPVLECAALLGATFRVNDVAETLGMGRLFLLQILRHLEQMN